MYHWQWQMKGVGVWRNQKNTECPREISFFMPKNAALNSPMSINHTVSYFNFWNFDPQVQKRGLSKCQVDIVNRGQPCKSLWFEMILFLDFVNPLTGSSVSVYLHLSVGQFMTRAPSWSLKWLQDLKFDWLQVQLTFRVWSSDSCQWHPCSGQETNLE